MPRRSRRYASHKAHDLAQTYDDHVERVYGFFGYRVGTRADAEDLTQVTFEHVLKAWASFDERRAPVEAWIFSIARNVLVDYYRRERTAARYDTSEDRDVAAPILVQPGPENDLGLSPELAAALEDLSAREREVIALRFAGDLSGPEIADLLDLTLANVQQIASRGLRKLRLSLEHPAAYAANGPSPSVPSTASARRTLPKPT